jgi:hypothetical protein
MKKALICPAVLCLALVALALPGVAAATPTVTFKAKAVKIAGYPQSGNYFGHGAAVEAEYKIEGTEYGGFPPPLIHVNFYLPAGSQLHPSGFKTCSPAVLEPSGIGPKGCPKGSAAGPVGKVEGDVAFGSTIVPEDATIESFYAPGGGLTFFTFGHEPVLLEILSKAKYIGASGLYSKELEAEIPLVETVPGAQDASVKYIKVKAGSARKSGGKTYYYGTLPTKCPKHYLPVKTELTFAGLGGLTQTTVTKEYHAACPTKYKG